MQDTLDYWLLERLNYWLASSDFIFRQAFLLNNSGLPELILACSIVYLWFSKGSKTARFFATRCRIILIFFAFVPTYLIARLFQNIFHRSRPLINFPLKVPVDVDLESTWNLQKIIFSHNGSFPSDHEALFLIFTTVAFTINRRLGFFSLIFSIYYGLLQIAIGYHWPSDVIGGAALGFLVALSMILLEPLLKKVLTPLVLQFEIHPAQVYLISFLLLSDFVQNFRYLKNISFLLFHYKLFH